MAVVFDDLKLCCLQPCYLALYDCAEAGVEIISLCISGSTEFEINSKEM